MPFDVGQEDAADAAGGAAGHVVDVAACMGFPIGAAVNPGIETTQFHAFFGKVTAAPNLHTCHLHSDDFFDSTSAIWIQIYFEQVTQLERISAGSGARQ